MDGETGRQTDRQTDGQNDLYVSLFLLKGDIIIIEFVTSMCMDDIE